MFIKQIGLQLLEKTSFMEANNLMDKYAVAVKRSDESIVGYLRLGKSGKFAKTIFYFLKANKKHSCVIKVLGKAINVGDGLGMKVPYRLLFFCGVKMYQWLERKPLYAIVKLFSEIYPHK